MIRTFKHSVPISLAHTGEERKRLWRAAPDLSDKLLTVLLVKRTLCTMSGLSLKKTKKQNKANDFTKFMKATIWFTNMLQDIKTKFENLKWFFYFIQLR